MKMFRLRRFLVCLMAGICLLACLPAEKVEADYYHVEDQSFFVCGRAIPLPGLELWKPYDNCWEFGNEVFETLHGYRHSESMDSDDDMLREMEPMQCLITEENLRAFVAAAPLGSLFRLCNGDCLYGPDVKGHSQVLLQKDDAGFTVYEGNIGVGVVMISYYTFNTYVALWAKYSFFKYVKYPDVLPFTQQYLASTDLQVSRYQGIAAAEEGCTANTLPFGGKNAGFSLTRSVDPGTELRLTGRVLHDDGSVWYRCSLDGEDRFVSADSVRVKTVDECTRTAAEETAEARRDSVTLYSAPSSAAGESLPLETLKQGDRLRVTGILETADDVCWMEVTTESDVTGYVRGPEICLQRPERYLALGKLSICSDSDDDADKTGTIAAGDEFSGESIVYGQNGSVWIGLPEGGCVRREWTEKVDFIRPVLVRPAENDAERGAA